MSTEVTVTNLEELQSALNRLRSDESLAQSYVLVQHEGGNPNRLSLENTGDSINELNGKLDDTRVQYALVKMTEVFDMSTTVKFVYIHWLGEKVPFVKKGRYGVVHGDVKAQFFSQYHVDIETSTRDEISEQNIMRLISDNSGTRSKVLEMGAAEAMPRRGFTSTTTKEPSKLKSTIPMSSKGATVEHGEDVLEAIADVRNDEKEIRWACIGYTDNDVKKPLKCMATGAGTIDDMKEHLDDSTALYFLYRTTDDVDGNTTVKFVYIVWVGESVKPMSKAKLSTHKGVVQEIFSGSHVTIFATARNEISEHIINDKVQSASGTKSHVK